MDEKRKKDLEKVMRKETGRGPRPVDLETKRKRTEILTAMRKLLMLATEEEFVKVYAGRRTARRVARVRGGSADLARVPTLATVRWKA
jgi:hypothetical protein